MNFVKKVGLFFFSPALRELVSYIYFSYFKNTKRKSYKKCGKHTQLRPPLILDPALVELGDYTRLQPKVNIISGGGTVVIKKYSAIGGETVIIPGSHVPTVGLPQFLSTLHINDTETNIVIEEDVWVGVRCILLSHCKIGRGAVVAAASTITKNVPPYAVVAGSPGKVIATRFTPEQILQHEAKLYAPEERLSIEEIERLFEKEFKGLRAIGTSDINYTDALKLKEAKGFLGIKEFE